VSSTYQINEARMVQRRDGTVLVNGRDAAGGSRHRVVAVSTDRGLTWSAPKLDGSTGKFNACDAGLVRYTGGPGSTEVDRILFSRPDAPVRRNMTVSVSYDEGHSFRYSRVVNSGRSYYSDLARLSDGTIVLVYGCDGDQAGYPRRVAVARFDLDWLTAGRDTLATGPAYTESRTALGTAGTASAGTLKGITDPVARSGKRSVWTPAAVGDTLEYGIDVPRAGSYDLLLRHYRPADGGLVEITVNGTRPRQAFLDLTREREDGYDIAHLGTVSLPAGRNVLRFRLAGPGRGGGTTLGFDELNLVTARGAADVRNEVLVDDDDLGYLEHSGVWNAATGVAGYWGSGYTTRPASTGDNVVRFRLVVPDDGNYLVQASYAAHTNRASNAPYYVKHATGTTLVRIDQRVAGTADVRSGQWVSLGTFRFAGGLAEGTTVSQSDDANGYVVADAIRLIRQ
jgi:BNR repeat protein